MDEVIFRELAPDDLGDVVDLHRLVVQTLPDRGHLYARATDHFAWVLAGDGSIVGAFDPVDGLVGYSSILRHDARDCAVLALDHLPLDPSDMAQGAGLAVHPAHRGRALMARMTAARRKLGLHLGARFSTALVSVRNLPSLRNMHSGGYIGAGTHHDSDGANFIFLKALQEDLAIPDAGLADQPAEDVPAFFESLASARHIAVPVDVKGKPCWRLVEAASLLSVVRKPGTAEAHSVQ